MRKARFWILPLLTVLFVGFSIYLAIKTPDYCVNHYSYFIGKGEIGDAIGGTITPLFSLVAVILALAAFCVQYRSLVEQRNDIAKERFLSRFSQMLDICRINSNCLSAGYIEGKRAAKELVGELYYTYSIVYTIYHRYFFNPVTSTTIDPSILCEMNKVIDTLKNDSQKRREFITKLSYCLFYYGLRYTYKMNEKGYFQLVEQIKDYLSKIKYKESKEPYSSFLECDKTESSLDEYSFQYELFQGHNNELGNYFRHLYQTVKYISQAKDWILDEEDKYLNVRMLRSQMSDYEQMLLYYNGLSDMGSSWNKRNTENNVNKISDLGLIGRFRLVKNIPANICWRGINPIDYYKLDKQFWDKKHCFFFENPQLIEIQEYND